jgi:diguanylate cyclase (GGDEF)-like protein
VTALRDIRERRAAEEQIRFLAHHDVLTGLANRFKLLHILTRELSASRRHGKPLAVLCIDLDRFKAVNDTLGHHAGDELLRQVADRIRENIRDVDTAARVGGDEFILLLTGIEQASDAAQLAHRLIARLSEPYDIDGHRVSVGASGGIAVFPKDGGQVEHLLQHADVALYRVKEHGRGDFCFYEAEMDTSQRERRQLEVDLATAIRTGRLQVAYQPIFHAGRGDVVTFEALARWTHPRLGNIPPSVFIPLAEESNLIIPLGLWVLETACAAATTWQPPCRVAVNVSARQFMDSDMPATVAAVLKRTGLPAGRLELEVTESLLITNTAHALAALESLKQLGIRIVLDDFGTGYSNLSYLQRFPFDKIKVDKSFIDGLATDNGAQTIVAAILAMSHQLNVNVVAEGVETNAQLALLRFEHCDEIQGFLLGRPLRSDRVEDYLSGSCSVIEAEEPDAQSPDSTAKRDQLSHLENA